MVGQYVRPVSYLMFLNNLMINKTSCKMEQNIMLNCWDIKMIHLTALSLLHVNQHKSFDMFRMMFFQRLLNMYSHQHAQWLHKKQWYFTRVLSLVYVWLGCIMVRWSDILSFSPCVSCCYYSCRLPGSPWNQSAEHTSSTLLIKVSSRNYSGGVTINIEVSQNDMNILQYIVI